MNTCRLLIFTYSPDGDMHIFIRWRHCIGLVNVIHVQLFLMLMRLKTCSCPQFIYMVVTFSVPTHYRVLIRGATNINQTLSRSDNGLYGVAPSATIACLHLRAGFPVQAPIASQLLLHIQTSIIRPRHQTAVYPDIELSIQT